MRVHAAVWLCYVLLNVVRVVSVLLSHQRATKLADAHAVANAYATTASVQVIISRIVRSHQPRNHATTAAKPVTSLASAPKSASLTRVAATSAVRVVIWLVIVAKVHPTTTHPTIPQTVEVAIHAATQVTSSVIARTVPSATSVMVSVTSHVTALQLPKWQPIVSSIRPVVHIESLAQCLFVPRAA